MSSNFDRESMKLEDEMERFGKGLGKTLTTMNFSHLFPNQFPRTLNFDLRMSII